MKVKRYSSFEEMKSDVKSSGKTPDNQLRRFIELLRNSKIEIGKDRQEKKETPRET